MYSGNPRSRSPTPRVSVKSGLNAVSYAIRHHALLEKHTSILVGVSGGIDSLALLLLLQKFNDTYRQAWYIKAAHVDAGFPDWDSTSLEKYLAARNINITIARTKINKKIRKVDDKCFFCARARRQRLMEIAEEFDIANIALAHHQEDVAETLLLNILYAGKISTLLPRQPIVHGRFVLVRPLYYLDKPTITQIGHSFGLESFRTPCPYYKCSRRERIRAILATLKQKNPDIYSSIFHSIFNINKTYMPFC